MQPQVYHVCTLHECHQVLRTNLWKAGSRHAPSKTSPMGVYCASTPSAALDRALLERGYALSQYPWEKPNGWDCPVVIGLGVLKRDCPIHQTLKNGAQLRHFAIRHELGRGAPVDVSVLNPGYTDF